MHSLVPLLTYSLSKFGNCDQMRPYEAQHQPGYIAIGGVDDISVVARHPWQWLTWPPATVADICDFSEQQNSVQNNPRAWCTI